MKHNKSDELVEFLDSLTKKYRGRSLSESWKREICVWCGNPAGVFVDYISYKRYSISGLCQKCQDETFEDNADENFM